MSTETAALKAIPGNQSFTEEQNFYLDGFFAGVRERAMVFADLFPGGVPGAEAPAEEEELTAEERIKREEHPLDSYYRLAANAVGNKAPDREDTFRFKWHGLFFLSPIKDSFMARLRIPGGILTSHQLRALASIASDLTTGYVQVTTRANFQIRLIQPKDTIEFLRRVQATGLHSQGSGADNIRNLTGNPTAGVDPVELIDCTPYLRAVGDAILHHRDFYNLPRKFNIAFDGGGLIGSVQDTNDIGIKAVKHKGAVAFRIALGGATGHKSFARDCGIVVEPKDIVEVVLAMVRVFIKNGDRSTRKKARLKHLLETWSLEKYVAETEAVLGRGIEKLPLAPDALVWNDETLPHSHIGVHPQKQKGLNYLGVALPIGQITPKQMIRLADLAENYGMGELRLTVWQNIVIPGIADAYVETVKKAVSKAGLDWKQSNVASGVIACTGNRYCKFTASDTKGHAAALTKYLEKRLTLDQPVNIHFTGCPHSCAQHYMGDIGLLGAKTHDGEEAYHVFVGGGFGSKQACGRQIFQAMTPDELYPTVERMLKTWIEKRGSADESFQSFVTRHDVNALQVLFSE
ncbi:MAG: NirA family protein [Akkermansiaceae bacterium]|nr:NirA family protein [Akkermansiaceae bacterium]